MEEKARAWWAIINTVAAYIWQGHNASTTEKSCFSRTTRWTATFKRTVFPKPSHARITGLAQKLKPTLLSVILVIHTSWMSQFLNEAGSDKKKQKKKKTTVLVKTKSQYWHKLKMWASKVANPTQSLSHFTASIQCSSFRKKIPLHNSFWHQCVWALCNHKCTVINASCNGHQLKWSQHHKGLKYVNTVLEWNNSAARHRSLKADKTVVVHKIASTQTQHGSLAHEVFPPTHTQKKRRGRGGGGKQGKSC